MKEWLREAYDELFGSRLRLFMFLTLVILSGPLGFTMAFTLGYWGIPVIIALGMGEAWLADKIVNKFDPRTDS